jgi:hypothetical protein
VLVLELPLPGGVGRGGESEERYVRSEWGEVGLETWDRVDVDVEADMDREVIA